MVRIGLVLALIVVGGIAGSAMGFAPAYLAIPLGLVLLVPVMLARRSGEPQAEPEHNRLGAPRLPFTERDRETLAE